MRTTLDINDGLLQVAKEKAVASQQTLTAVVEDCLRIVLTEKPTVPDRRTINIPTSGSGGLMPGVDINNSAELLELMESDDGDA